jgi:predicted ATPase/class 3 adenylate cyclase
VGAPSGTVTFLFTDVEGSTRLWELAPDATGLAVARHDAILRGSIEAHEGYVFSTAGDGFAAAFARAADALGAAVNAQAALGAEGWPEGTVVRVRMGLYTGEASERGGDYFGPAVNRAARLMDAGHGGQVLVAASTAAVLGPAGLVDLGEHRLRDLTEPQRVFQWGAVTFPPLRVMDAALSNLPLQATELVGRRLLVGEVADLVVACRAVTLTGPGGVGKTRLALEVGAEVLPKFPDGVWLVDLAPVAHDEMVLPTIAGVLGISAQSGESLITTVVSRLVSRRLVIILDNCEHLITPVARFVERVTASAPEVRVLATSREGLGVPGERVRPVPPLDGDTEAVELFVQQAVYADPAFDAAGSMEVVREICHRLDGIPLAIELAAARSRHLSPEQIAGRLDQRFRLLTGGGRTAIERHRTLQATLSWSYEMLDPAEQVVFQRLSLMAAPFDLDAAEAVTAGGGVEEWEVLDVIGHLVDKSMVTTIRGEGELRYRLLETLRQFGADGLAEAADHSEVRDRYARYWSERASRTDRSGTDPVLDAVDRDLDHYRAAFAQLLTAGDADICARAFLDLAACWQIRHTREGMAWCQRLLGHDLAVTTRVGILAFAAQAAASLGGLPDSRRLAHEAITLADSHGLPPPWDAHQALLIIARANDDAAATNEIWPRASAAARQTGNPYLALLIDAQRTTFATELTPELVDHFEQLIARLEDYGSPLLMALACHSYGSVRFASGDTERGLQLAGTAVSHARRAGPVAESGVTKLCAPLFLLAGQAETAAALLRRSLPLSRDLGHTTLIAEGAALAALIAADNGDLADAAALTGAARRHLDALGAVGSRPANICLEKTDEIFTDAPQDLSEAQARGAPMTVEETVNLALAVLDHHYPTAVNG